MIPHKNYQSSPHSVQVMLEHHCATHKNCGSPIALYSMVLQQLETNTVQIVAQNNDLSLSLLQMITQTPPKS